MDVKIDVYDLMHLTICKDELAHYKEENHDLKTDIARLERNIEILSEATKDSRECAERERQNMADMARQVFYPNMNADTIAECVIREGGNNKISAIRRYRLVMNIGLKEAKDCIEATMERMEKVVS